VEAGGELAGDGSGDVERYERLRACALGEPDGWRLGLALLERRGVAAWTRAWQTTVPVPPPRPAGPAVETPAGAGEIVGLLATMALACLAGR